MAALAAVQVIGAVVDGELIFLPVQREAALGDTVGEAADDGAERSSPGHVLVDALVAEHHVTELAVLVRHQDLDDLGALVGDLHHHARAVLQRVEIGGLTVDLLLKRLSPYLDVRRLLGLREARRCLDRDGKDHETPERDGDHAIHLHDLLPRVTDGNANALTIASGARDGASWCR